MTAYYVTDLKKSITQGFSTLAAAEAAEFEATPGMSFLYNSENLILSRIRKISLGIVNSYISYLNGETIKGAKSREEAAKILWELVQAKIPIDGVTPEKLGKKTKGTKTALKVETPAPVALPDEAEAAEVTAAENEGMAIPGEPVDVPPEPIDVPPEPEPENLPIQEKAEKSVENNEKPAENPENPPDAKSRLMSALSKIKTGPVREAAPQKRPAKVISDNSPRAQLLAHENGTKPLKPHVVLMLRRLADVASSTGGRPGRKPKDYRGCTLSLADGVKENPRREGSARHAAIQIIVDNPGIKFEDWIAKGGHPTDLVYDANHGNKIKVTHPNSQAS